MSDLDIHRRLHANAATVADLDELASWPLARRIGYLGVTLPLVLAGDPAMRAAALRALAGSRGYEGVHAIVGGLDDADDAVRAAALEAMRVVAREVPERYAHALFHPRVEVRRASLEGELSLSLGKLAIYLRADPACADLAAKLRWPDDALPVALELYAAGHVPASELVEALARTSVAELRALYAKELARTPEVIDKYLDTRGGASAVGTVDSRGTTIGPRAEPGAGAKVAIGTPPGRDVLDTVVAALADTGASERSMDAFVETVSGAKGRSLARRAAVALLGYLMAHADAPASLVGACIALEPRVVSFPIFTPAWASAAVRGLFRFKWPVKPPIAQTRKLLELPVVRADLALAAAIAGLLPAKRLASLRDALGQTEIVARLVAADAGWDEICRLPGETPALEVAWLAAVEKADYKRYVTLAGRALAVLAGKRLETFVEQLPRRHRQPIFIAALAAHVGAPDEKLATICKTVTTRCDRMMLVAILQQFLVEDLVAPVGEKLVAPDGEKQVAPGGVTHKLTEQGRLAHELVRAVPAHILHDAGERLDDKAAHAVVVLAEAEPFPRAQELALASGLRSRTSSALRAWCKEVGRTSEPVASIPQHIVKRALTTAEAERIARCADRDLEAALAPALAGAVTGLCTALKGRDAFVSVAACAALLGCADPIMDVARTLDRFAEATPRFDEALDEAAARWRRSDDLAPLALARLWRWEHHAFAFLKSIAANGGPLRVLLLADSLPGRVARDTLWKAVSEGMMLIRYRDLARFREYATEDLAKYCASRIDREIGRHAARLIVSMVETRFVPLEWVRDVVLDRVADADMATREYVARIVRLVGVAEAPPPAPPPPEVMLDEIRACTDLERLAAWCTDVRPQVVQEAALALVILGAPGQQCLAMLLATNAQLPTPAPVLASILLWDDPAALSTVRELGLRTDLPAAWRFYIQLSLHARGEPGALDAAIEAVRATPGQWYFRREDWDALVRAADVVAVSIAVADSPHHHAYQRAINILLSLTRPTPEVTAALVRFLEAPGERPLHLRWNVARRLAESGDVRGLPLLVEYIAIERAADWPFTLALVPATSTGAVARAIVDGALIGGHSVCSEKRMWEVIQHLRDRKLLPHDVANDLDLRILEHAATPAARRAAAKFAVAEDIGDDRLTRVAEIFAWGVRRGIELGGRLFSFHLTAKETEFGHTRLDGSRIFVSALPMLRGEAYGRDVVEGLVLHEIGHHVYHRSPEALALWKKAHAEGIGHFLNLIADEHLERNLRAVDPDYGDRLKRLGAYAFQHAPQEIKLAMLLGCLRGAAAPALIAADLQVAFDEQSVRMRRGAILGELDRGGHPVARFARALRMGLGNRANDPLVAQALALCGKDLRTLDMAGLYALTKQLVGLFGGAIRIASVFGGPEGLEFGERDDDVYGAGLDDDILQREVERILDPRRAKKPKDRDKEGGHRLQLNVSPDTHFDRINHIVRIRGNPEAHAAVARHIERHASRLRQYLDELGLRWEPQRARTQGRALDRTRLRALVTRNDPRILVARNPTRRTDLFLGVLIDCSGSMQAGNNIDRARRFAILVAETVAKLPGVEARFFGFTDSTIYDAGEARDCAVVSLVAEGGNNDAAALYHAANVAINSTKRAKVLVMISDGLPTESSIAALKNLVVHLTRRRNIVCAQVAVRKLEEICFPNYVVLDDSELDIAVAKFGRMIGDLARRSLAS